MNNLKDHFLPLAIAFIGGVIGSSLGFSVELVIRAFAVVGFVAFWIVILGRLAVERRRSKADQ